MQLPDPPNIAIIGLGYVGLPLAVEFGRIGTVLGFDVRRQRLDDLRAGNDRTREVAAQDLQAAKGLRFSDEPEDLRDCNVFIVTVPTPIDEAQRPDLEPLHRASAMLGTVLKRGDVVIYESTVYPGTTEEVCVPILEEHSGLRFNQDFYCGYSPERVSPGDRERRVSDIRKITSGSTPEVAEFVDSLYRRIIRAGTHRAESIRVAEAAKVIENVQRDVNIALVNELAMLFQRLGIDTQQVLAAAGTKWNFLPFRPGLVGGHCIGVDPYYLTYRAQVSGYHPDLILAARRINSRMGRYVADRVIRLLSHRRMHVVDARILVLGLTFKENCPDLRNTRVVDLIHELQDAHATVDVFDPWADPDEARAECGVVPLAEPGAGVYDAVVLAVAHRQFAELGAAGIRALGKPGAVLYDVKGMLPIEDVDGRL
jgi:UDP-N-acetyl-D-glucosamine/UDP-N-acetyl-D-galactosamine dehydrogenase